MPPSTPIILTRLLPNEDVVQGRQPSIQHAVRRLLAVEPGLRHVAEGRAPTRDEVAALHTTCHALVFSLSSQVPPSLRAAVARWLAAATRQAGRPTSERVPGESITLAQELLAFAAPSRRPPARRRPNSLRRRLCARWCESWRIYSCAPAAP